MMYILFQPVFFLLLIYNLRIIKFDKLKIIIYNICINNNFVFMKIAKINPQGQLVIPIELRRKFNIDEKTYLKIYEENKRICISLVEDANGIDSIIDFPKNENQKGFYFQGKDKKEKNLADKVDEILYYY